MVMYMNETDRKLCRLAADGNRNSRLLAQSTNWEHFSYADAGTGPGQQ